MTTDEVMARFGLERADVCRGAKKNGVGRTPVGGILAYDWTEEDCEKFAARPGKGWKKGRPRKKRNDYL
jgi:hypothetical protein